MAASNQAVGPARLVEDRCVGDLELGDGEGPVEPG